MKTLVFALLFWLPLLASSAGAQDAPSDPPLARFTMGDHPSIRIGSSIRIDLRARAQADARLATPDIGLDQAQFDWKTPRVGVEGTLARRVEFEVSRDLGEASAWKDVYLNYRLARAVEIEAGRFKVPFGREMLTGPSNLDFVYRSLAASELSPSRDTGLMGHGRLWGRWVRYQAGYFVHDGDNARTAHTSGAEDTLAFRVLIEPFKRPPDAVAPLFQAGIASTDSRLDNCLGLRGNTVLGDGVFFDRVYVNGRRRRTGLEGALSRGPASITSEYIVVSDQREAMGFAGETLPDVRSRGWYVAATWVLTGERKDGRVEPRRAFLRGGFGAVEVTARVEALKFDDVSFPGATFGFPSDGHSSGNENRVTTFGLNWSLDRFARIQGNVILESIPDWQRSPAPTALGRFLSIVIRTQFVL